MTNITFEAAPCCGIMRRNWRAFMIKTRGLRSVLLPAFLLAQACLFSPAREAAALTVDTSSVLSEPAEQEQESIKPDPAQYLAFAVRMQRLGNLPEAKRSLAEVRAFYPETIWEKRASFLLGLLAFKEGDDHGAIALLEDSTGIDYIEDYIVFFQAGALMKSGQYRTAAGAYDFIISSYPASMLRERAAFSKALALQNAGEDEQAAGALKEFIHRWPKSSQIPEANLRLAKSLINQGFAIEAVPYLKEVSTGYPTSAFAPDSDFLLLNLHFGEENKGAFSPGERFRRAENLFVSASYNKALTLYATLLGESAFKDKALFRTAVAYSRLKKYKDSEKILREYLSLKEPSREAEALYWLALVSSRQGREEGVLEAEKTLSAKYKNSNERAKVLMLLAGFKSGKDPEGALLAYRAVLDEFSGSAVSDDAFWKIAWDAYISGRYEDAYDDFSMYLDARPNGKMTGQFLYWQARSAEKLGRVEEAQVLFDQVCSKAPQSFYCLMSEIRSRRPDAATEVLNVGLPEEGQVLPAVQVSDGVKAEAPHVEKAFKKDPRYGAATELLLLGLYEQASTEIDSLARKHASDKASLVELAGLLYEARDYYRAFRIYRTYLSASNNLEHIALGYPPGLVETVKEKAAVKSADPYLVAAVMREESHFNPEAVSPVGAMGLMQIMPSTGRQIADELGEGFRKTSLLEPGTSIRFGSWYLGQLLKRFNGDAVLTIAGYNAGPNAAARWAGALPKDTDEFIESIPYDETRGYVKRALRSYAEFLRLGGEEFRERVVRPGQRENIPTHNEASAGAGKEAF